MPGPLGAFLAFVLPRLGKAIFAGVELGGFYSGPAYMSALSKLFPELSFGQVAHLGSAAIWARTAGLTQMGLGLLGTIPPGDVPSVTGLGSVIGAGNNVRYYATIEFGLPGDDRAFYATSQMELTGLLRLVN